MQFATSHQPDSFAPILQRILRASGQLFQRRLRMTSKCWAWSRWCLAWRSAIRRGMLGRQRRLNKLRRP